MRARATIIENDLQIIVGDESRSWKVWLSASPTDDELANGIRVLAEISGANATDIKLAAHLALEGAKA